MNKNTAIVTGSSGGLGLAIVKELLVNDWYVLAGIRNKKKSTVLLNIANANLNLQIVDLDVTNSGDIMRVVNLANEIGNYKLLVNNAGMAGGNALANQDMGEVREVFEVNLFGPLQLIKKSLPILNKNHGTVINVSSIVGSIPAPYLGAYSASKHALNAVTIALALETQRQNIKFLLFEPGPLSSKLCSEAIKFSDDNNEFAKFQNSMKAGVNYVGRKYGIDVEKAAKKVVRAVNSNKKFNRFSIGVWGKTILTLNRFLPTFITQNILAKIYSVKLK